MPDNRNALSLYRYDQQNRIESQIVYNLNWGCKYKYMLNYRKVYYFSKNTKQITKQKLINNNFEMVSSLVDFNGSKYYVQYLNGKEIYTKFFNKNKKSTFEKKVLLNIGDSSIKELKFKKQGKIEKNIEIITKQNGNKQ